MEYAIKKKEEQKEQAEPLLCAIKDFFFSWVTFGG